MAEQSAFLIAFDEMQKKKGGFNAPAPLESVVDTVGQAPAVQSPFGQQAGLLALKQPYGGVDLRGDPRPTSNEIRSLGDERQRDSVENSGTFTQGLERAANFIYGDGDKPFETRSEQAKRHSATYYRIADDMQDREQMVLNQNPMLAPQNPLAAPVDLAAAPAVQAPQADASAEVAGDPNILGAQAPQEQVPMLGGFEVRGAGKERFDLGTPEVPETLFSSSYRDPNGNTATIAGIEAERARANAVEPSTPVDSRGFFEKFADATRSDPTGAGGGLNPFGGGTAMRTEAEGASGELVDSIQSAIPMGLPGALPFEGTPATPAEAAPAEAATTPAVATPAVAAPVMDGSQIPQTGEEGFKFAERGSPQDYFLSNTNGGTTALSPEQITRGQEYAKQQGLNFDPTTGFSQSGEAPQVQAPQGLTTAGGQPLAEFLAGGQQKDAQGRMIDPNVDRSSFEQASADREARQAARPDFGEAQERAAGTITDAERRGNGAPTALFKEEAEAAGLSGRAKSDFISEKTRLWSEAREDREVERASGQAAGERANIEMQLKIKDWEKTNADERKERVDEMNTEIGALTSIIGQAENISGVAQEAGRQVGAGTTGFFSPLKFIGGTTAADLAGNLETIKSDAFVANITEMRKNSPTGGAVGNVSDKDLDMLQSLQTSFRQNLKPTTLRANLKKYQKIRAKVVTDAKKGFVLKYGQENLNKYFGGGSSEGSQGGQTGSRHPGDQDHGAKVETHFQGK